MDRQHRRDLRHDRFVDEVGSLTEKARANQRVLLLIALSAVVIALIGYGVFFYRGNREHKAQDALGMAIDTIESPLIAANQQQPNPLAKYKTDEERAARAETQFREVQKKFSGTDAADVTNLYIARIAANRGDIDTARKLLQEFVGEHPKHILVAPARLSLYEIRIEKGEAAQVATELNQELAKSEDQILPPDTMLQLLAYSYEVQGNAEKSKDAYRRIVTQFPDSPYALDAQRRLGSPASAG